MTTLWQDVIYGIRMLLKKPGFTAIAAFSLALGIGANTAIFSLVNTVLLSSLAYRDPSRLVMIETTPPGHPETSEPAMIPDYIAWKQQSHSFESLGAESDTCPRFGIGENGDSSGEAHRRGVQSRRVSGSGGPAYSGPHIHRGRRSRRDAGTCFADQPAAMAAALRQRSRTSSARPYGLAAITPPSSA